MQRWSASVLYFLLSLLMVFYNADDANAFDLESRINVLIDYDLEEYPDNVIKLHFSPYTRRFVVFGAVNPYVQQGASLLILVSQNTAYAKLVVSFIPISDEMGVMENSITPISSGSSLAYKVIGMNYMGTSMYACTCPLIDVGQYYLLISINYDDGYNYIFNDWRDPEALAFYSASEQNKYTITVVSLNLTDIDLRHKMTK